MKQYNKEKIKKIIKYGFDLKLISFELDIPIEYLEKIKRELENEETKKKTSKYSGKKEKFSKIEQMRRKYNALTGNKDKSKSKTCSTKKNNENKSTVISTKNDSQNKSMTMSTKNNKAETKRKNPNDEEQSLKQQNELIEEAIRKLEEIIQTIPTLPKDEKNVKLIEILTELKKIETFNLNVEQAEKVYYLINIPELHALDRRYYRKIDYVFSIQRKINLNKLLENIQIAQAQTDDIEELKMLQKRITPQILQKNQLVASKLNSEITNKIYRIQKEKLVQEFKNNISENIIEIVKDLANGTVDIEKANLIIDAEAKKRVKNRHQNKFTLTEEQEKKQILVRIRQEITGNASKYKIINPSETISQMQNLCGGGIELAIKAVVENFIQRKEFETAENICNTYLMQRENPQLRKFVIQLRKKVKYAEIGDLVLKVINTDMGKDEEDKLYEQIKIGVQTANLKLNEISIGKSKDGLRTIYLSDIWDETEQIR